MFIFVVYKEAPELSLFKIKSSEEMEDESVEKTLLVYPYCPGSDNKFSILPQLNHSNVKYNDMKEKVSRFMAGSHESLSIPTQLSISSTIQSKKPLATSRTSRKKK
ncbi:unnamed protein product [Leptidea sinapis]|uniref:Uncharacterized protein n=1 Tax=Leptidea sinapis TaxID=189913 RepID=A0A5E4QXQ2_9NEOP|nr:unnamed protein product [Leptidea sinapis]